MAPLKSRPPLTRAWEHNEGVFFTISDGSDRAIRFRMSDGVYTPELFFTREDMEAIVADFQARLSADRKPGELRAGDRVRAKMHFQGSAQRKPIYVGDICEVRSVDEDGDPILTIDPAEDTLGWPGMFELVE